MLKMVRKSGITSQMLFSAGFISIGLSVASWMASRKMEAAGLDRADRWGIFVGEWAPTFFALGTALRLEEHWSGEDAEEMYEQEARRAATTLPVG